MSLVPGAGDVSRVIGSSLFQPPLTACRAPPPFNSPFQSLRPPLLLSAEPFPLPAACLPGVVSRLSGMETQELRGALALLLLCTFVSASQDLQGKPVPILLAPSLPPPHLSPAD